MDERAAAGSAGLEGRLTRFGGAAALALGAALALAILAFYAARLSLPLPLFAADEAVYLIRALYPDELVARYPFVAAANNGVHLSVIRALYAVGGDYMLADRLADAAAYLGGLAAVWWACRARESRLQALLLLLLAIGFPYYRFAFSNLAEGLYVGVLALLCVVTARWAGSRPLAHAALAGLLCAALVLVKPNGMACVAALGLLAGLAAVAERDGARLALRLGLFAASFLAAGNAIQAAAHEPVIHPLIFFVSDTYADDLKGPPPAGAWKLGLLEMGAMTSAVAVLAAAPIVAGAADLWRRWRAERPGFAPTGADRVWLLLVLSLAATLVMVAIFAMQIAGTESETRRLWGRYFEFFAPLLWLAAAPALARPIRRGTALAAAGVTLAGLAGLFVCFRAGIVLFPWDSSILTAFFAPAPPRAQFAAALPYRLLAALAVVAAAGALAWRARAAAVGLGLVLALGVLSTHLDHAWMRPMVEQRRAQARDMDEIARALSATDALLVLTPDVNEGHLAFLRLAARPVVAIGPPEAASPELLAIAGAVILPGDAPPPGGPWMRTYRGQALSLYRRAGQGPALAASPAG